MRAYVDLVGYGAAASRERDRADRPISATAQPRFAARGAARTPTTTRRTSPSSHPLRVTVPARRTPARRPASARRAGRGRNPGARRREHLGHLQRGRRRSAGRITVSAPSARPTATITAAGRRLHARPRHRLRAQRDLHGARVGGRRQRPGRRRSAGQHGGGLHVQLQHDGLALRIHDIQAAGTSRRTTADRGRRARRGDRAAQQRLLVPGHRARTRDARTSEGIFVFTRTAPTVTTGQASRSTAAWTSSGPAATTPDNLTITEIVRADLDGGRPGHDPPHAVGFGGRIAPIFVIDNDAVGRRRRRAASVPPGAGRIDFYESLEGMLVRVNNPVAVGPTSDFGEIPVVGDCGCLRRPAHEPRWRDRLARTTSTPSGSSSTTCSRDTPRRRTSATASTAFRPSCDYSLRQLQDCSPRPRRSQ